MNKSSFTEEEVYELADFFKIFADSTRLRILMALSDKEMKVGDIASALNMSLSAISHQLRVLRQARLTKNRREGKEVYYALNDDHIKTIIMAGYEHTME